MSRVDKSSVPRELPFRQLAQFWNWLPAFRAVAEARGINEAARLLHISSSALSRSVALLEAALGEALFYREGGLALTPRGETLLEATRNAMRTVHDATAGASTHLENVRIATTSRLGAYRLLSTLRTIRQRWPDLEVQVKTLSEEEIGPQLLRGEVDLVISTASRAPPRLSAVELAPAACHVYCGRGHALFAARRPTELDVVAHPFAAPVDRTSASGVVGADSWPTSRSRRIALTCDGLEPAIDACVRGELLVCLPDEIVVALELTKSMRALEAPVLPATVLTCIHRPRLGPGTLLLDEILTLVKG